MLACKCFLNQSPRLLQTGVFRRPILILTGSSSSTVCDNRERVVERSIDSPKLDSPRPRRGMGLRKILSLGAPILMVTVLMLHAVSDAASPDSIDLLHFPVMEKGQQYRLTRAVEQSAFDESNPAVRIAHAQSRQSVGRQSRAKHRQSEVWNDTAHPSGKRRSKRSANPLVRDRKQKRPRPKRAFTMRERKTHGSQATPSILQISADEKNLD